jgi:predicted nucleic acid-binding protein
VALTLVDSGVLIGLLDSSDAYHDACKQAFVEFSESRQAIAMSTISLTEILVHPMRKSVEATRKTLSALEKLAITFVDVTPAIAQSAAKLRAKHAQLRTPAALIISTAQHGGVERLFTTDSRLMKFAPRGVRVQPVD